MTKSPETVSRRDFLQTAALAGAVAGVAATPSSRAVAESPAPKAKFKQVPAYWCFCNASPQPWTVEQLLNNAAELGLPGVELLPSDKWQLIKEREMVCAATPSHSFLRGMNNRRFHAENIDKLKKEIKATADAGFPNVMTFTGVADTTEFRGGSKVGADEGMANCIAAYKQVAPYATDLGVTMVLESLNSRATEPMRGHPGYQGDHIDYCAKIVREVDSLGLKLLFDAYHVQVMDGDLVRRIHEHKDIIAHVQIAGNPGRGPVGNDQEINYAAVMRALVDIGYDGYVGHEWIPTGDPLKQLKQGVAICNV